MRDIDSLLATYGESHRHPVNERIHMVCVPAIMLSLLGILWALHWTLALAAVLASLAYYARLSRPFMAGMALMAGAMLALLAALPRQSVFALSVAVFVLAWVGQFVGHKIEGRKPSFLDDLRFLLIGPLFVLSFLYRRLNLAW